MSCDDNTCLSGGSENSESSCVWRPWWSSCLRTHKWYNAPFHPESLWPGHIPVSTGHNLLDAHHSQWHFMDKNQVPSLKETTVYLTSFTSLLSLAGRTWGIKKHLYKPCKISWNIRGLPVSDEEMVREQVHELWEYQVRRNYTTTIINNSNNSRSSNLDQSHIIWCFLMLSFHISDLC